jgi:cAMP phosphodiesterase
VLAVDAGSHLASITRILQQDFPLVSEAHPPADSGDESSGSNGGDRSRSPEGPIKILERGPFTGLALPYESARANAVHVVREHVSTYLITHPHLDHLCGFAINTAAFHNTSRPKRLAALPFTVNAIKAHIFNDIIWPNLTDENNGVGLVTFQRLTEGGNPALGEGTSRGFIEVCNGLAVKGFKVSHGKCASNAHPQPELQLRRNSIPLSNSLSHAQNYSTPHTPADINKLPHVEGGRRASMISQPSQPGTPTVYAQESTPPVVDSTAFFIRADKTGKEILIFGDVEPDSISLLPRTHYVWSEAATKIVNGLLTGVFIECSYNDSQDDKVLFGHLAPRHLIQELQNLGDLVAEKRREVAEKIGQKRKRTSTAHIITDENRRGSRTRTETHSSVDEPMNDHHHNHHHHEENGATSTLAHLGSSRLRRGSDTNRNHVQPRAALDLLPYDPPLKDVKVIIIHVKDSMMDGPLVGESILEELREHEAKLESQKRNLGCTFSVCNPGDSFTF